jgi:GNAT superfamily N-acetyltransferase
MHPHHRLPARPTVGEKVTPAPGRAAGRGRAAHNGSVRVRAATADDADAIASVQVRSWQAAYRGLMPDEVLEGLTVERRVEVWRSLAAGRPKESVLVLEGDGGIEGFAHVCAGRDADADAGTGEVSSIYLLPAAWGKGRGRALMEAAVGRLSAEGYHTATLWVLVSNDRARRFYETAGWSCDGTEKTERVGARSSITETRYRRPLPAKA